MSAIDEITASARSGLQRVEPERLSEYMEEGALVVDIRPEQNRISEGELPGAIVIDRIVLEWRLDPTSPDAIGDINEQRTIVIVCNEGYASSLAAESLQRLGLANATDLIGGFRAWKNAGLDF